MTATFTRRAPSTIVTLTFRALGPLEVVRDGTPLAIRGKKQQALLAVLLSHANEVVSADRLIDELWGESAADGADHTLRTHVSQLRKVLEPEHSRTDPWTVLERAGSGYRLNVGQGDTDVSRFEMLVDSGKKALVADDAAAASELLGQAVGHWRGRPFGGVDAPAVMTEASRLSELHLNALETRIAADLAIGRNADLIGEIRELVGQNPYREPLRGHLMLALYRAGRQTEALAVFREFSELLGEELGLEPGPDLKALEEQILLQDPRLGPERAGPKVGNLPAPTSSFVGRDEDVATIRKLLGQTRLLTLTGTGGVGKTRLAIELARRANAEFANGVWVVELAPLREADLIAQTTARILDVDIQPDVPVVDTLSERLRSRSLLLVIDNCEHLVEPAAELISVILRACPDVRIIATSREPLRVAGETQLKVPPLEQGAARDLFVERAKAHDPGFEISGTNDEALESICRRLDGVPLAIELAAARVETLNLPRIEAGLDDRFSLLTAGERGADDRQRTLEATLDWSHDLLSPDEQMLLRRLSVFRGTFGYEAAQALDEGLSDEPGRTLDVLSNLVAKSLVTTDRSPMEMRYELLETIRQYSRHKLIASGEEDAAMAWHEQWFTTQAKRSVPHLNTGAQLEWLDRMEADHDNLRAVLDRAVGRGDHASAIRLTGSMASFWFLHSYYRESVDWIQPLIPHVDEVEPAYQMQLWLAAGRFAWRDGKEAEATEYLTRCLEIGRKVGSELHVGWASAYLALVSMMVTGYQRAQEYAGDAIDAFQRIGDLGGFGFATWSQLAARYLEHRHAPEARRFADEARDLIAGGLLPGAQAVGDRNFLGHLTYSLAIIEIDLGEIDNTAHLLRDSLVAFRELGNKACAAHTLDQVARWAVTMDRAETAARILAATDELRGRLGIPGHSQESELWSECREEVQGHLSEAALAAAWDEGHELDYRAAMDLGLANLADG